MKKRRLAVLAIAAAIGTILSGCADAKLEHKLELVAAVDATCTEAGNSAYYTCSHCDKLFADADGATETTLDAVTVAALEHDIKHVEAQAPTCGAGGWDAYDMCKRAGCDYSTKTEKPATGIHTGGTATHTDKAVCDECGKPYGETIPHTYEREVAEAKYLKTAATCTGAAVYYKSCECGAFDVGGETFTYGEPISHAYDREVAEAEYLKTAATCTDAAVYYKSCECGEFDANGETFTYGEELGHDYGDYEVFEDGHRAQCGVCRIYTQKAAHVAQQLDWGKADQTCKDCGHVLHEKLFTAFETPQKLNISTSLSGQTNVTSKTVGAKEFEYNGQTVSGVSCEFSGNAGQRIVFSGSGGGITGTGAGTPRQVSGMYFKNYGETEISFKYYLDRSGVVPASTDIITLAPGEDIYTEFTVDMHTFTDRPWSRLELIKKVDNAKLEFVGYLVGTLADGAYRLRLPSGMTFSDGTSDKFVTAELGNALLQNLNFTVGENELGFYNFRKETSLWLANAGQNATVAMDNGDLVIERIVPTGDWTATSVMARSTSSGTVPPVYLDSDKSEVGTAVNTGDYSDTKVLYTVNAQNAGAAVMLGCASHMGRGTSWRLARVRLTRVSGDMAFNHSVNDTKLATFDGKLDEQSPTVEFYFIIPADVQMGDSGGKPIKLRIAENMTSDASFVMECETINI